MDYRIEIWKNGIKVNGCKGTLKQVLKWYKRYWQDEYEADPEGIYFSVYENCGVDGEYCLSVQELIDAGFIHIEDDNKKDENLNLEEEVKIQDKMIDMLCELLEKHGGDLPEICDEVSTDDCTLECKTCIRDVIRKKVMEEK